MLVFVSHSDFASRAQRNAERTVELPIATTFAAPSAHEAAVQLEQLHATLAEFGHEQKPLLAVNRHMEGLRNIAVNADSPHETAIRPAHHDAARRQISNVSFAIRRKRNARRKFEFVLCGVMQKFAVVAERLHLSAAGDPNRAVQWAERSAIAKAIKDDTQSADSSNTKQQLWRGAGGCAWKHQVAENKFDHIDGESVQSIGQHGDQRIGTPASQRARCVSLTRL